MPVSARTITLLGRMRVAAVGAGITRLVTATAMRLVAARLAVILVAAAALYYLRAVPVAGNDVLLYAVLGGTGLLLGIACETIEEFIRRADFGTRDTLQILRTAQGFDHLRVGAPAAVTIAEQVVGVGAAVAGFVGSLETDSGFALGAVVI